MGPSSKISTRCSLLAPPRRSTPHDHVVGPLVVAGPLKGGLTPLRLRLAADRRFALTTAVRMVARVHHRAPHGRPPAHVPTTTGLADLDVLVVDVADLTEGRHAVEMDQTNLARRHPDLRIVTDLGHHLGGRPGRADHLSTLARRELDVVHLRTGRDVAQRQGVTRPDRRVRAGDDHVAHPDAEWRQHVALLAVDVEEQRDPGRAVRVVLDGRDLGRHAGLVPLEVDEAVEPLIPAAAMPRRDPAAVVATGVLLQRLDQAFFRLLLGDLLERADTHRAARRGGWLVLSNRHSKCSQKTLNMLEEVDVVVGMEGDDCLLPAPLCTADSAEPALDEPR